MSVLLLSLIFISAVLVVTGIASIVLSGPGFVDNRLAQISGRAHARKGRPGVAAVTKSALRRLGRVILFESARFLSVGPSNTYLKQRMSMAGYHAPESARGFSGFQLMLSLGLMVTYLFLWFAGVVPDRGGILIALLAAAAGFLSTNLWLSHRIRWRRAHIVRSLPNLVDLLIICMEAGQGIDQALARVGLDLRASDPVLSEEIHILNIELRTGKSRADALRNLFHRTGVGDLKSFAAILIQADRFGVSVSKALKVFSEGLRTGRRQEAEEAAAKTMLKITFPLVLFIFPALMILLLGPAILQMVARGMGP